MIVVITVVLAIQIAHAIPSSVVQQPGFAPSLTVAAERAAAKRVCRDGASLRHAPAGVTIGHLRRGDRVIVTQYARRHRWAFGISAKGHGWLLTSALCRRP